MCAEQGMRLVQLSERDSCTVEHMLVPPGLTFSKSTLCPHSVFLLCGS